MAPLNDAARLTLPLHGLESWTAFFRQAEIPVEEDTAEALEALRTHEDQVDASTLAELVCSDPLMTLKVMAHASLARPARRPTETETVTASLVMMGISPFFQAFGVQPTLQARLQDMPQALDGVRSVVKRAHRAANFALAFAVHRMDPDAAVIQQAALLHDFAEMLLWCHAPVLALRIRTAQEADSTLRSSAAQRGVLGIELGDLQQALMRAWRLPELLIRISDDKHTDHPSVRNVVLAMRLARHTAQGWNNAALPDDVNDIAQLLNLSHASALALVRGVEH